MYLLYEIINLLESNMRLRIDLYEIVSTLDPQSRNRLFDGMEGPIASFRLGSCKGHRKSLTHGHSGSQPAPHDSVSIDGYRLYMVLGPGAPSSFLLVVRMLVLAMPGAPSSVLAPSSKARSP